MHFLEWNLYFNSDSTPVYFQRLIHNKLALIEMMIHDKLALTEMIFLVPVKKQAKVGLIRWCQLYNSVIFEGATLVYRPDCNAEGGCHANSARAKRGRYWLWQPPEALQEGRYTSVAPEQNHAISIITTWSHNVLSFYKLFACGSVPCGALI